MFNNKCEMKKAVEKMNPLENDVVIHTILSFLNVKDVKSCRLINSQWNGNTYGILEKNSTRYNLRLDKKTESKLSELLSLLESSSPFLITKKVFIESEFLEVVEKENLLKILALLSPNILNLAIKLSTSDKVFNGIIYPQGLTFPHLKNLHIFLSNDLDEQRYLNLFNGIFYNSPKLAHISLTSTIGLPISIRPLLQEPFLNLFTLANLSSLVLHSNTLTTKQYELITNSDMKLKMFGIFPGRNNIEVASSITRFLKSQSETLEFLHICLWYGTHLEFELPRVMAGLKVLEFLNYSGKSYRNLSDYISCLVQFPVLKKLKFKHCSSRHVDILRDYLNGGSENKICHNFQKLNQKEVIPSLEVLIRNEFLMPNLTTLEIPARLAILKKVYVNFRNLQMLKLNYFTLERKENCNEGIDNILLGGQQLGSDSNPDKLLLALIELKTLRIESNGGNIIGEDACLLFMKMKSLKLIEFSGGYNGQTGIGVSSAILDEMRKKILILIN